MSDVFRFLPGERVLQIVGLPGPDTDQCEVVEDAGGETVRIRYQIYGKGPFHESEVTRDMLLWQRGSETSQRYHAWQGKR